MSHTFDKNTLIYVASKAAKLAEKEAAKAAKLVEKELENAAKTAEKAAKLVEKELENAAKTAEKAAKLAEKESAKAAKLAEKELENAAKTAEKAAKLAEKEAEKKALDEANLAKLAQLLENPYTGEKINIFDSEKYISCEKDAEEWEKDQGCYYTSLICCKTLKETKPIKSLEMSYAKFSQFCTNSLEEIIEKQHSNLCVLPNGHTGECCKNPHMKMFKSGCLSNKFDTGIYSTPGNDDVIFKNRASRLFSIAVSDDVERKIKNKEKKLSCAIPLKDRSTPLMLAAAYVDYLVLVVNVSDIDSIKEQHEYWEVYQECLTAHKQNLTKYFNERNRRQFNDDGFTICSVNGYEFKIDDLIRDSRVNPKETDTQLGHCLSRKDTRYTIRGFNISLMTREGNRLVGDYDFFDDTWINKLRVVVNRF